MIRHLLVVGALAASGCSVTGQPPAPFAWLHPEAAPPSWGHVELAGERVVLFFPHRFSAVRADAGALSRAVGPGPAYRAYLNVTPNDEPVAGFPAARIEHQRDEELDVHELGRAAAVSFTGGRGACVHDRYTTRVGAHHYEEYACLVRGRHGRVEVVTAAPTARWRLEAPTFRLVLDAVTVR